MGHDSAKPSGSVGRGDSNAIAAHSTVGKKTLVQQISSDEHNQTPHGEHGEAALTEAPKAGPLNALRFNNDADLVAVATGKKTFASGATGIAVTKVQRALVDLGQSLTVSGTIDAATGTALKTFQNSKSVTKSGIVDKATMLALDAAFTSYSAEARVLAGMKPPSPAKEGEPIRLAARPRSY